MGISSALGSQALLPAGLGFRNAIINGDFRINQRGFSSTTTDGVYGHDRWQLAAGGTGTTTYSTQAFTLGNAISNQEPINHARLVTTGQSGTGVYSILSQKIESVRTFAGQTVTVSFWAKANSGTPKIAVELTQNFGSGGSPSSEVNTYGGQATLSTSWQRFIFAVNLPSISGKTLGTSGDYLRLLLWCSAGTDFNSRTGSLGIQTNTFDIWGVQVEQNYQPTPFENRPIGLELHLCMRYYERSTTYYLISGVYGSSAYINVVFKVRKRTDPSISGLSGGTFDGTSVDNFGVGASTNAWVLSSWIASAEL